MEQFHLILITPEGKNNFFIFSSFIPRIGDEIDLGPVTSTVKRVIIFPSRDRIMKILISVLKMPEVEAKDTMYGWDITGNPINAVVYTE